ncbi:hypothetical protein ACJ41O_000867 [Fusarium nematophilum]
MYIPAWTDPSWQDEGHERQNTDWKIQEEFFDRLRPAQLAKDQFKQPTKYAHRFSIFPGRGDGRSRTSPTRSESRQIWPGGEVETGKELFDRFEQLAWQAGRPVEDYMAEERLDMKKLDEASQKYMQMYEDLILDENWQHILFGSMTMDEVSLTRKHLVFENFDRRWFQIQAEGYFPMDDAKFDELFGPLYPFLERHKWADTSKFGSDSTEPRLLYNIDGERGEWDPVTNDRVWDAMQPALQLATRFLLAEDTFTYSLQDVTHRYEVDSVLYYFQPGQTLWNKTKFKRELDLNDTSLLEGARKMSQLPGFNPSSQTFNVLDQLLELRLGSGFHDFENKPMDHAMGRTHYPYLTSPDAKITVSVDAELVWVLMVDKYSKSEKMMASIVLAATLAHEIMVSKTPFCRRALIRVLDLVTLRGCNYKDTLLTRYEMQHAWACAPIKWLSSPRWFGITNPVEVEACTKLYEDLCPGGFWLGESYFEDDPVAEVGHAFENHVLGGGFWPCIYGNNTYNYPRFIQNFSGIASLNSWPEGFCNSSPNLDEPKIRRAQINHFLRVDDMKKFFTMEFWDNAMKRYGTAALREPSKKPHKVTFNPADGPITKALKVTSLGTETDRMWLTNYLVDLGQQNKDVLFCYIKSLVAEACEFDVLIERFKEDSETWGDQDQRWITLVHKTMMIIYEFSAFKIQSGNNNHNTEQKRAALQRLHQNWEQAKIYINDWPDFQSMLCLGDLAHWSQSVMSSADEYQNRLIPKFSDLMRILQDECAHQESMVCELYQLPPTYWQHYRRQAPNHGGRWCMRAHRVSKEIGNIISGMRILVGDMPVWSTDWEPRMRDLGYRFQNIMKLLALDPDSIIINWRDFLVSMPTLRKSRRKPHQRWFFLAKKVMQSMQGADLDELKKFKNRFQDALNLGRYKVVLPMANLDELNLAQRWAGTLDDEGGRTGTGPSTGVFDTAAVKALAERLAEEEREAEAARLGHAASQSPEIQHPEVENHPVPFAGFPASNLGQRGPPIGDSGPDASSFASYSGSSLFPSLQPGQSAPWATNPPTSQPGSSTQHPPRAVVGIMPHPYAVRETITADLQNAALPPTPTRDPAMFANLPPREGNPLLGAGGGQGSGALGNVDQSWEQQHEQDTAREVAEEAFNSMSVEERILTLLPMVLGLDTEGDANMSGTANSLRLWGIDDSSSSSSSSEMATSDDELERTRESSETSAVDSVVSDNGKPRSSTSTEVGKSVQKLKRKRSCSGREEAKAKKQKRSE